MVMGKFNSARSELKPIQRQIGKYPEDFDQVFPEAKESYKTNIDQSRTSDGTQEYKMHDGIYVFDKFKNLFKAIWVSYRRIAEFFQSWELDLTTIVVMWISI